MRAGDNIVIESRAIYASSTCTERAFERTVIEIETIKDQDAFIVTLGDSKGRITRFRQEGNYLFKSFPRAAKYEIVS